VAGYWPDGGAERAPERWRGEGVAPVARAAVAAADEPGTEVAATRVAGDERGRQGRWAMLLRRRRQPLPEVEQPHADGEGEGDGDDRSALVTEPAVLAGETGGPGSNDGAVSNDAVEPTAPVEGKTQR
jgi:nicotinamidase-related amidase